MLNYKKLDDPKTIFYNKNQKIFVIDGLILKNKINKILESITKSKNKPSKIFKHRNKIIKFEFNNFNNLHYDLQDLIKEINSRKFIKILEKIFNIDKLYPDKSKLFSGLSISNKGSRLKEHVDFNYNKKIKKFRYLNLLLYLNKNYKSKNGGIFFIKNFNLKKKIRIKPTLNKAVIFHTNSKTPHGFTKINSKERISLNMYYYTNKNYSLSKQKHRTIWK